MIDVYVWNPIGAAGGVFGRSVGHGAMLVLPDPARPERGRYISWWPLAVGALEASLNVGVRPYPNTWSEDLRDMGRPPDFCWMLNRTGTDFDETAIMRAWDAEASRVPLWSAGNRANPEYRALDRNCCSTVMNLLFGPGGGARYRTYGPIPLTWWNPNDVNAWMEGAVTRGLALGISPAPPPPGGVPAFGRSHLEGPEADRLTELGRRLATRAPPRPRR